MSAIKSNDFSIEAGYRTLHSTVLLERPILPYSGRCVSAAGMSARYTDANVAQIMLFVGVPFLL
jgi:hypothetical protein